jgi:hypothetical protein
MSDDPDQMSQGVDANPDPGLKDPPVDQAWLEVENVRSDSTTDEVR